MANLNGMCAEPKRAFATWCLLWVCLLFAALTGVHDARAQAGAGQDAIERQVKAAYLSKFGGYIEWPPHTFANQDSPLKIGIIGADMLADDLTQIVAGRTVNGRQVAVRKLRHGDSLAGLNVLFIGGSDNSRLASTLAAAKGQPMLTITESDDGLVLGSTINFLVVDSRVRFEVAPKAAGLGNLSISARLLAAAYRVVSGAS